MNDKNINFLKTFLYSSINLILIIWTLVFFIWDIYSPNTLPLISSLGVISCLGMLLKKHWGLFFFKGYVIFTIAYQTIDLIYNFGAATILQILLSLPILICLSKFFDKNGGFIWIVKK